MGALRLREHPKLPVVTANEKGWFVQDFRTATFLNVCKTMNYTKSAQELNITQPAVSQHIAYIEKFYGAKLFEYKSKKLSLTQAGELLLSALAVAEHDERMLKDRVAGLLGKRRTINLGVTMTAGEYVLARPLAQYLNEDQEIQTRIIASGTRRLLKLLKADVIDCALVEGFFDKKEYAWEPFCTEELVLVASPQYRFAHKPVSYESLLDEHLLLREEGSGTRAVLEHELAARNLTPESFARTTEINSLNIIKTFVQQGYGITFLYKAAVRPELKEKKLKSFTFPGVPVKHDMTFVWLKGSHFKDEIRTFVTQLREIYNAAQ